MYQIDNNINMLHFDLNLTEACNMRCDYCFEPKKNPKTFSLVDLFISKMSEILDSDYFKKNYELLNINFWGGEPTLQYDSIIEIVERFRSDDRVRFFIFSNGYNINPIKWLLSTYKKVTVKGNHPKICIQISYDGVHLHDIHRRDLNKCSTSERVLSSINWLDLYHVPYVIKPVIKPEDFRFLSLAYHDIKNLTYEDNPSFFKSQNYNPTIEYYDVSDKNVDQNLYDLRKSMIEIASDEYIAIKDKGHKPFFTWLYPSKAICCAGLHYFAIDVNGDVYPCHGMFYSDNKRITKVTNISNDDFIQKLKSSSGLFTNILKILPDECKSCETTFCMKCNVVKFQKSQKTKYIDRWTDYANQPTLCKYYKEIGKIAKIFNKKMRKG